MRYTPEHSLRVHLNEDTQALASAVSAARMAFFELVLSYGGQYKIAYPLTLDPTHAPGDFSSSDATRALWHRINILAGVANTDLPSTCRRVEQARAHLFWLETACYQAALLPHNQTNLRACADAYMASAALHGFLPAEAIFHIAPILGPYPDVLVPDQTVAGA